jgi:hypothetical protein
MQNHYYRRQNRRNCFGRSFVKKIAGIILLLPLCGVGLAYGTTYSTDGSSLDVQLKIILAVDGDTVTLPAGTFTWTTGVIITGKAITIQGAGSGRIIGRTLTSVAVGTGTNTFTTQAGLSITPGQTLRVVRRVIQGGEDTDVSGTYMQGTVTSYSGTSLEMNITSTGGSGTFSTWYISTIPSTIIHYTTSSGMAFSITPSTGNVYLAGIKFLCPPATANAIHLYDNFPAQTIIHDCWFYVQPNEQAIDAETNAVLIYNCSFESAFSVVEAIRMRWQNNPIADMSWSTVDTLGNRDTDGNKNFYVEDCDFHYFLNSMNFDDNSRVVARYCTFDNAGIGSHGEDTGLIGTRHYEVYNNSFIYEPTTNGVVLNVGYWFFIRGGTGVWTGNDTPALTSQDWGNKSTLSMTVENLRRNAGNEACWGANTAGVQWPAPHQVGQGYNGTSTFNDPLYIWSNTGTGATGPFTATDYLPNECGANADSVVDYIISGRDYISGTARPGYVEYTYPHPLHGSEPPSPPQGLMIVP